MKRLSLLSLFILLMGVVIARGVPVGAQTQAASAQAPPLTEEQQKAKAELEKKAFALLEQVISEAQSMHLPENRIRVQITAGDLLWDREQSRARALFMDASAAIAEQMRNVEGSGRQYQNLLRTPAQLRQELVLTVARHDSTLAYQVLAATRPPAPPVNANREGRDGGPVPLEEGNLERILLQQIAASDPKVALQNAEELLAKGQYSSAMSSVLAQLQDQDKEAAAKFQEKLLRRLQGENLLANPSASSLAMAMLRPGPRVNMEPAAQVETPSVQSQRNAASLAIGPFRDLMESVVAAALKATPQPRGNQQNNTFGNGNNGRPGAPRGGARGPGGPNQNATQQNQTSTQSTAQVEQNSARSLLGGLQSLLPQIDTYLPARSAAVRQKMGEMGMNTQQREAMTQMGNALQAGDVQGMLNAAAAAPAPMRDRLYQAAAMKAADEGNADLARQIANDHLDAGTKTTVLQSIDVQLAARVGTAEKIQELRQSSSNLKSEEDRIKLLLQLAAGVGKNNPKLALEVLDDARNIVSARPTSYQQFDSHLRVSRAFMPLDAARSLEVLEPGIIQLNELLPAAALLSGFEVNIFKNGELPLQGGNMLSSTVMNYAQQISMLAKDNFDLAAGAAEKFQMTEPKVMVRLAVVKAALGKGPTPITNGPFGFGPGGRQMEFPMRRP